MGTECIKAAKNVNLLLLPQPFRNPLLSSRGYFTIGRRSLQKNRNVLVNGWRWGQQIVDEGLQFNKGSLYFSNTGLHVQKGGKEICSSTSLKCSH